jgi:hypothetical protein
MTWQGSGGQGAKPSSPDVEGPGEHALEIGEVTQQQYRGEETHGWGEVADLGQGRSR